MSANSQRRSRKFAAGAFLALLGAGFVLQIVAATSPADDESPSARSFAPAGRRAAFEFLERLGHPVELWQRPPSSLPRHGGMLVCFRPPQPFGPTVGDEGTSTAPLDAERALDAPTFAAHHPRHYRRFVEQGGVLLVPASEEMFTWLVERAEFDELAALELRGECAPAASGVLRGGAVPEERIAFAPPLEERLAWRREVDAAQASTWLIEEPGGDADAPPDLGAALRVGAGTLLLLADADLFANERLDAGDHALLLARIVERFAGGATVLFDEYALGAWQPTSPLRLIGRGRAGVFSAHLLALLLLLAWRAGWIGPFPRDPQDRRGISPLERVRAEARLYRRARRDDLLAARLYAGVVDELEARLRLAGGGALDREQRTARLLAELRARGVPGAALPDAVALDPARVRGPQDLRSLAEQLRRLEHAFAAASSSSPRPTIAAATNPELPQP